MSSRPRPVLRLLMLGAAQVTACGVFILAFKFWFGLSRRMVVLHLINVSQLLVLQTLLLGGLLAVEGFRRWHGARHLVAGVQAAGALGLLCLYAADTASNYWWGSSLSLELAWGLLSSTDSALLLLSAQMLPHWAYFAATGAGAALYVFFLLLFPTLDAGLLALRRRQGPSWLRRRALVISVLVVGVVAHASLLAANIQRIAGEPLVSLFWPTNRLGFDAIRSAETLADAEARLGYPRRAPVSALHVVVVLVDSLRPDHMQVYGYDRETTPFLSRLLGSGKLRRVEAAVSGTTESVGGILGVMTSREFRYLSANNFKVYDALKAAGYRSTFVLSGTHEAWYDLRAAYGKEIDFFFDGAMSTRYGATDDRVLLEGLERVPPADGRPSFFYFHLMSAHTAGSRLDPYQRYQPSRPYTLKPWAPERGESTAPMVNAYDNGVLQADSFLERIFAGLTEKGYLPGALVFVLGDHGEGLGEHGRFGHNGAPYQEQIRIPLLIWDDSPAQYRNLSFAAQIDVAPTILDRLGLPIPGVWHGASLLRPAERQDSWHQAADGTCRALIHREGRFVYKYMVWPAAYPERARERLYELTSDPGETLDLLGTASPERLSLLRARLAQGFGG